MPVTATRTGPGMAQIRRDVERLRKSDILVGIPQDHAQRPNSPITNASLMWILSKGSALRNLPPRPVVEMGIEKAKDLIAPQLAAGAKALLANKPLEAQRALGRAGTIAENSVKRMFGSSELAPNAPSTIAKKGSSAVLIDTSSLRRSVTHVIRVVGKEPVEGPSE